MTKDKRRVFVVSFDNCLVSGVRESEIVPNQDVISVMKGERECTPPAVFVVTTGDSGDEAHRAEAYQCLQDWGLGFCFLDTDSGLIQAAFPVGTDCSVTRWDTLSDMYRSLMSGLSKQYDSITIKPTKAADVLCSQLRYATTLLEKVKPDAEQPLVSEDVDAVMKAIADLEWDLSVFVEAFGISGGVDKLRRKKIQAVENVLAAYEVFGGVDQ